MLNRNIPPVISPLPVMPLPGVTHHTLPNGVDLMVINQGSQPVFAVSLEWDIRVHDILKPEYAGLLSSLIKEGTMKHPAGEWSELLEFNGIWSKVGIEPLAVTMYSLNKTAHTALALCAEMITSPELSPSTAESIKQKSAAKRAMELQKVSIQSRILGEKMLFGENVQRARSVTPEDILNIDIDKLPTLHRDLFLTSRPRIFLAGKITPEVLEAAMQTIGTIDFSCKLSDESMLRRNPSTIIVPERTITRTTSVPDSMQTAITINIPTINKYHPDYVRLRHATIALGGYFGSRLMSNIREDKGYTYDIGAALQSPVEGGFVSITTQTAPEYAEEVLKETEYEIGRLAQEPMPEEELAVVKQTLTSSLCGVLDSPFSIMQFYENFLRQHAGIYPSPFAPDATPQSEFALRWNGINRLTANELSRVVREHLAGAPMHVALAGPF